MVFPDLLSANGVLLMGVGTYVLNMVRALPAYLWNHFLRLFSVVCSLEDFEYPWDAVVIHLSKQKFLFKVRKFKLARRAGENNGFGEFPAYWSREPTSGTFFFWYSGKLAIATRTRREIQHLNGNGKSFTDSIHIRFLFSNDDHIIKFVEDARKSQEDDTPTNFCYVNGMNGWTSLGSRKFRNLDSVLIPPEDKERILSHLRNFYSGWEWRNRLGIPRRTGILLTGPPGSGKTSLIKAVADAFKSSVHVLSLSSRGLDDAGLSQIFQSVYSRAFIIIEDIDAVFKERSASDECKVTFSGLLNAIDGILTREGFVLWMTTNHPERIDPALIRPGRVDLQVEIGYVKRPEAASYYRRFYDLDAEDQRSEAFGSKIEQGRHSMAELQAWLLAHISDPDGAIVRWPDTQQEINDDRSPARLPSFGSAVQD